MVDRRTFTTLLVGGIAAPGASFAQNSKVKNVFYSGVGPELTLYSIDVDEAALVRPTRGAEILEPVARAFADAVRKTVERGEGHKEKW